MKKLIYCAAALAAMIFAGSCQQENLEPVAQENTVTYTVELPGVETKAIADGSNVNRLYYEVWKIDAENATDVTTDLTKDGVATRLYQNDIAMTSENGGPAKTVVTLNLVQDQEYTILFWAQNNNALGNGPAYNTANLTAVTYVDAILNDKITPANNESLAAFYAVDFVSEGDPKSKTIYLKRPFAQLNIGTLNTVDANEYAIAMQKSQVTVSSVPTVFNVATSVASAEVEDFVFDTALVPNNPEHPEYATNSMLQANGVTYQYAAMNYIFANYANAEGQSPATVEVDFNIDVMISATDVATPTTTPATINHKVPNVPLSQNYRTNIVGNLLTSETEYNVIVDPDWADGNAPDGGYVVEKWNGTELQVPQQNANGEYEIEMASELAWLAAAVNGTLPQTKASVAGDSFNGKTFVLTADIDLDNQEWTPIGLKNGKAFEGTFNGNGKTIKNLNVKTEGAEYAALFGYAKGATIKGIKVENATIISNYKAGVIVGEGNCTKISDCHVKNVTITSTPDKNNDNGNQAGGIVGHLVGESGDAEAIRCSVENATITAYRDVAGIAGTALQRSTVTGNTVKNVTVVANQAQNYKEVKAPNAGAVTGRIEAKATIEPNTVENVEVYVLVDKATRLQNVLLDKNVKKGTTEIRFNADIKGNVTVDQQEGKNIVINGNGKKYDGTITIDGNSRNDGAETLVIKDVIFETTDPDVYFVEMNSKDGADRYAHNVTITNCTFKGNETSVGARFRQCYDIAFVGCTMTSGHSLAQLYGCTGVTVEEVKVNAKSGISFGTSTGVSVSKSEITSNGLYGYGVRVDADGERTATISNTKITAGVPVLMRKATGAYAMNISADSKLESTEVYDIIVASNDYKAGEALKAPATTYSLNTNGAEYVVYPDAADLLVASSAETLKAAIEAAKDGDTIYLMDGVYAGLFYVNGKSINIEAVNKDKATINGKLAIAASGKTVNVKKIVFENSYAGSVATDHQYLDKTGTYCIGLYCASVNVEECTFNLSKDGGINFYAFNAPERCTVKKSVFNANGFRPIISKANLTVEECTFNDQNKYALQVWGNQNTGNETVVFQNNIINDAGKTSVETLGVNAGLLSYVSISGSYPISNVAFTIQGNTPGYSFIYDTKDNVKITECSLNGKTIAAGQCVSIPGVDDAKEVIFEYEEGTTLAATSEDLTAALNGLAKNIVLLPGTYEGAFAIKADGTTITGTKGAVISAINLNGKDNVTIKDVEFDAAKAIPCVDGNGAYKVYANIMTGVWQETQSTKGAHNVVIEGCSFTGSFKTGKPGSAIAFTDYKRTSGYSGNITIKECTFDTVVDAGGYDIYGYYVGDESNGHGDFVIENNTFKSSRVGGGGTIALFSYCSNTPIVVKDNVFEKDASIDDAIYVTTQSYTVSVDASNNTFAN